MASRMTPQQLAEAKAKSQTANTLQALATKANGHGVNRTDARKAQQALESAVGKRKAAQLQEGALQRAGAAPKGLVHRLLG